MASSTAELTLLLKAQVVAQGAIDQLSLSLDKVKGKAGQVRDELGKMGSSLGSGIGNLTENLLTGQDFGQAATNLGAFLAGETVQEFGASIVQKMAGSAVVQAVGGAMAAFGSTIGGFIAAAIPVGMALWPVLLAGAIVGGIVLLINNPGIVAAILDFAGGLVRTIVGGLVALPGLLVSFFTQTVFPGVLNATIAAAKLFVDVWLGLPLKLIGLGADIVRTIVGGLASLPGKIADVVRQAFANLKIDVGPFHITGAGIRIDLPDITPGAGFQPGQVPAAGHFATGGWAGAHGPELAWLGEQGPEFVRKTGTGSGGGMAPPGYALVPVSLKDIARAATDELYFQLRNAGTGLLTG